MHPSAAVGTSLTSGCDFDDYNVYASQAYTSEDVGAALRFYVKVARQDGWAPIDEQAADHHCYTKKIDAANAFLAIWIDGARAYSVTINATHDSVPPDGGVLC